MPPKGFSRELSAARHRGNLLQHRHQVVEKHLRVLAHWKMAEALHDGDVAAPDDPGHGKSLLRRAGVIVFARKKKQRAAARVDPADAASDVAIDLVEIKITLEHAWPALHVVPERLPAALLRCVGSDQSGNDGGADLAAMHIRPMQEIQVVIGIDMRAGL